VWRSCLIGEAPTPHERQPRSTHPLFFAILHAARILKLLIAMLTRAASSRLGAFVILVVLGLGIGACAAGSPSPWRGVALHRQDPARQAGCRGSAAAALSGTASATMFLISARSVAPPSAAALDAHRRGVVLGSEGQYEAALEAFRTAVFLSPDYAEAHRCIGLVLQEMSWEDEALVAYQEAVRLEPDFAFAWLNLAEILNVLGRNDEALSSYGKALKLRPELRDETRNLRNWLINAPRRKVNPNERLRIDSVSLLPPAGGHWVIEAADGPDIVLFRNNVGKGRRHTVVAEIKLVTVEPGRRGLPALIDELQRAWREVTRDPRLTPVSLSVGTARYSDVECVRGHGVVEDRGVIEGVVFLLESDEVHCPSPLDDRTLVTIAWSQRYPSWNDRLEFGKEMEPILGSLRFREQEFSVAPKKGTWIPPSTPARSLQSAPT
jgi:tetratricopeptide (TPR) repeat protein